MNSKRPRRLDLNAPLLSTRRSTTTSTTTTTTTIDISRTSSLRGSCDRVPFSWEKSPGKPKDAVRREIEDKTLPLPKPPPIRWQEESTLPYDDGCDGDVENDDDNNEEKYNHDHDSFSDAIDLLSLAESLNPSDKLEKENAREDVDLESDFGGNNNGSSSPNFMIQRFLPAATALAASSLSALASHQDISTSTINNKHITSVYPSRNNSSTNSYCNEGSCIPKVAGQAYSSSKGCGLIMLFPWRAKNRVSGLKRPVSGVKSPVRRARSSLKPQLISSRIKQHTSKYM